MYATAEAELVATIKEFIEFMKTTPLKNQENAVDVLLEARATLREYFDPEFM